MPPRLPRGCVLREDLVRDVAEALDGGIVEIVAGAGFGKTTLLLQALERAGIPVAWVSVDSTLADPGMLFSAIKQSLARVAPGFAASVPLQGPPAVQANALGNEAVEVLTGQVVLALDDVHLLGDQASTLLAILRSALPDNVHLATTSRQEIRGDWLRLALSGSRVGTEDLRFSASEVAPLLGPSASAVTAEDLVRQTEGWITGLVLAARSQQRSGIEIRSSSLDYLAQEVLSDLPPETIRFLEDTSVLDRLTPDLAAAVAEGSHDAVQICETLTARHFTFRSSDGEWYRHHHLLQEALQERLAASPERLRAAHLRAASAWQAEGGVLEAARHFLSAEDAGAAAAALAPMAEGISMGPDAGALLVTVERIPPEVVAQHPGLLLAAALARLQVGDLPGALVALPKALERLLETGEGSRAAMALHRLFLAQDLAGVPHEECIRTGERFLPRMPPDAPMRPGCLIFLASRYGFACNPDRADEALQAAIQHPAAGATPVIAAYAALVRAHYVTRLRGDHAAAATELRKGIDFLERHEEQDLFGLLPWAWGFEAIEKNWVGRHEEALVALHRVELWARRKGLGRSMAPAVAWSRALALVGLGRWDEAESEIQAGASLDAISASAGGSWATYRTAPAAAVAAHRQDLESLRVAIDAGLAGIETQGVRFEHPMLLCDLATAAASGGLTDTAGRLAGEAVKTAEASAVPWATARAGLTFAAIEGQTARALEHLGEALRITAAHPGFEELWTLRERARSAPLLATALREGLGPPGFAARLASLGDADLLRETAEALAGAPQAAHDALSEAAARSDHGGVPPSADSTPARRSTPRPKGGEPSRRPPLRFGALGGFSVHRGETEVSLSAFGRERSRALLAALLSSDQPIHRDRLLEWFWPDLPPDRGQRAFHVALHGARSAIEPSREPRAASVIQLRGETYGLSLEADDSFDVNDFLRLAQAEGRAELLRAEAIYTGEPFPEWPYEDWAQPLRHRVKEARTRMLERLGRILLEDGDPREASKRFRELLESELEREEWHRALMRCFWSAGEVGLALRQYQACRKVLVTRLGTEPSPETRDLYTRILREDEPRADLR